MTAVLEQRGCRGWTIGRLVLSVARQVQGAPLLARALAIDDGQEQVYSGVAFRLSRSAQRPSSVLVVARLRPGGLGGLTT